METNKTFGEALREIVVERDYATSAGAPNWSAFAAALEGVSYETLRRTITRQKLPSAQLIEECARALGIRPEYFLEYRLALARRDFDPAEIGLDRAIANLAVWADARRGASPGQRSPILPRRPKS
jgi:transcriptional regulator with XRE-family HTH domain